MTLRRVMAALALALVGGAGCSEGNKQMAPPPFDSKSAAWNGLAVPGAELVIDHDKSPPYRARASAHIDGDVLTGKAAFDATRARVHDDPVALATLAMLFLDEDVAGRAPWTTRSGDNVPEQQAIAQPPALVGDTLTYWRAHVQLADLVRCRATLSTGQVACELGGPLVLAARIAQDPEGTAAHDLGSDNVFTRIDGLKALGQSKDPAARARIIESALTAADPRERTAAIVLLGGLGGDGVVAAVTRALLHDGRAEVRQAAATALGQLHDPASRPALQKALDDDADARVSALAKAALAKL